MPFLILFAWMALEIFGFIAMGAAIGVLRSLLLIFLAFILGIYLLKKQSFSILSQAANLDAPTIPYDIFDRLLVLLAAFLLILPGFFSDILAIFLLINPIRKLAFGVSKNMPVRDIIFSKETMEKVREHKEQKKSPHPIIDAEFTDIEPK